MQRLACLVLVFLAPSLTGCAKNARYEVVKPRYERVTSEARELQLLQLQPLEIIVTPGEVAQLWQRAELFAYQYLGTTPTVAFQSSRTQPDSTALQFSSEHYRYSVTKAKRGAVNIAVAVSCVPMNQDGDESKADLNARNLARFMKEGRLQLSVLEK